MRCARTVVAGVAVGILGLAAGCSTESEPDPAMGSLTMDLDIADGVKVDTVSWTIRNATTGYTRSGTVDVRFSDTLALQIGGLPAGSGYTISLSAMSVNGVFSCSGSADFEVSAQTTTPVDAQLYCSAAPGDAGTVV